MGGTLEITSQLGLGSNFTFKLKTFVLKASATKDLVSFCYYKFIQVDSQKEKLQRRKERIDKKIVKRLKGTKPVHVIEEEKEISS